MWGMTAPVEPPELETRVAILMKKPNWKESYCPVIQLFSWRRIRSNVRELEGALKE